MGEADFNQIVQLRKQLVDASKNSSRQETLSTELIPKISKDMDEQFKVGHVVVDVLDRPQERFA